MGGNQEFRPSSERKSINYTHIVDLSHVIHSGIPQWPGDPPVEFDPVAQISQNGYHLRRFSMGEHTATHINAPGSFHQAGMGISDYSPESLVGQAVVLDVTREAAQNPDYLLTLEDVLGWEAQFGEVPAGSTVLLYSGWQEKWDAPREFFNFDFEGVPHFPGFGTEAVRFMLEKREIAGIGIDTHGVDGGNDQTFAVNRLMVEHPRTVLENLTNLDRLPPVGVTLVLGLLRLKDGSGSPVSALAFVS